jgi:hypothetical protein
MTTHNFAVDHSDRRLLIALPEPYDAAREHCETHIPAADYARFYQTTSWQAVLELAKSQAPSGWPRPRSLLQRVRRRSEPLLQSVRIHGPLGR